MANEHAPVTAKTITVAQIRASGASRDDIWDAVHNSHSEVGRRAIVRIAAAISARRASAGEDAARRLAGAVPNHCTTCLGPIDEDGECRCPDASHGGRS